MSNQEMEYRIESLNTLSFSKVGSAGAASEASRVKSVQQGLTECGRRLVRIVEQGLTESE